MTNYFSSNWASDSNDTFCSHRSSSICTSQPLPGNSYRVPSRWMDDPQGPLGDICRWIPNTRSRILWVALVVHLFRSRDSYRWPVHKQRRRATRYPLTYHMVDSQGFQGQRSLHLRLFLSTAKLRHWGGKLRSWGHEFWNTFKCGRIRVCSLYVILLQRVNSFNAMGKYLWPKVLAASPLNADKYISTM